jgi:hypothetical protein
MPIVDGSDSNLLYISGVIAMSVGTLLVEEPHAVTTLTWSPAGRPTLARARALASAFPSVPAAILAMYHWPGDPAVQVAACEYLASLLETEPAAAAEMLAMWGAETVLLALLIHARNVRVRFSACRLVIALSRSAIGVAALRRAGGVRALLPAVLKLGVDPSVAIL